MTVEDISWSTVGNDSANNTILGTYTNEKEELAVLKQEKESAQKLFQAALRADTLLEELDTCSGRDIRETIEFLTNNYTAVVIPELKKKAAIFGKLVVVMCSKHSVSVYLGMDRSEDFDDKTLKDLILKEVRSKPELLFSNDEISLLSESGLESILADKEMGLNGMALLRLLVKWINFSENRLLMARNRFLHHIDFDSIAPSDLASPDIRNSGIFTDAQLLDMVFKQSPRTIPAPSSSIRLAEKRYFGTVVWNKAKTEVVSNDTKGWKNDSIPACSMSHGSFRWKVQVERPLSFFVGAINTPFSDRGEFLGIQGGIGIMIQVHFDTAVLSASSPARATSKHCATVKNGDVLTCTFVGGSYLSISWNAGCLESFSWSEMTTLGDTFIPVVGVYGQGSLKIISFEQTS